MTNKSSDNSSASYPALVTAEALARLPHTWDGDPDVLALLNDQGAAGIDRFLLPKISYFKASYKRSGDPRLVYLAAATIAEGVAQITAASSSLQFARLLALMSEMLIAEGRNVRSLTLALDFVERALEVLGRVECVSDETTKAEIEFALYRAIAQKALGQFDKTIQGMRQTIQALSNRSDATYLDLITLHRQEIMMMQDVKGHAKLAEAASQYASTKPIAYYGTIKRVFEFAMNKKMPDAKRIFPEFKRAYAAARRRLPVLSHISFTKNVGQMLAQNGQSGNAVAVLRPTMAAAQELNLLGQERQLRGLVDDIIGNTTNGLVTFRVEK